MSAEGYANFLIEMGHNVREAGGLWWFNSQPHIYMSFPFHRQVDPRNLELSKILGKDGWVARFPCDIDLGYESFRIVCDTDGYDLKDLLSKSRNQTRRGLENCTVRRIEFEELMVDAIRLNRETLIRQGRKVPPDLEVYWTRYYRAAAKAPGAEVWGAYVDGSLAAYLISFTMEGIANILIVRSAHEFLAKYPNNALLFSFIKEALSRGDIDEVSIGLESVQKDMDSLDRFKTGLGFKKVPVGQRIELSPWLRPWLRGALLKMAKGYADKRSESERFSKLAGMLKWYSEQPRL